MYVSEVVNGFVLSLTIVSILLFPSFRNHFALPLRFPTALTYNHFIMVQ